MTLLMITFHWLAKVQTLLSILFVFLGQNEEKHCFDRHYLLSLQSKSVTTLQTFQRGQSILYLFTQTTSSTRQAQETRAPNLCFYPTTISEGSSLTVWGMSEPFLSSTNVSPSGNFGDRMFLWCISFRSVSEKDKWEPLSGWKAAGCF